MGITAIICIAIVVVVIVIILTIIVYNQMLLLNEVNKRLLVLTRESIEREQSTQEELQDALIDLEQLSNEQPVSKDNKEEPLYQDPDLDL